MTELIDLTGQIFDRLTVIHIYPERVSSAQRVAWVCECLCGKICIVTSNKLRTGHTRSCGCLQRETTSKMMQKDILGRRFGRLVAIKRLDKRKNGCFLWQFKCDCGKIKNLTIVNVKNGTKSCGCLKREYNLNQKPGKSGYKNIQITDENTYLVRMKIQGKEISFGTHSSLDRAKEVVATARAYYHKDYRELNSLSNPKPTTFRRRVGKWSDYPNVTFEQKNLWNPWEANVRHKDKIHYKSCSTELEAALWAVEKKIELGHSGAKTTLLKRREEILRAMAKEVA